MMPFGYGFRLVSYRPGTFETGKELNGNLWQNCLKILPCALRVIDRPLRFTQKDRNNPHAACYITALFK